MLNAAVLGKPVHHSLSPVLHGAGYRALGLSEWRYAAHEIGVDALAEFVAGLDETWRGLSLTMPLKEAAFQVVADVSDVAARSGAVNTLVRRPDGTWAGENTDVQGIVAALADVAHDGRATVLGAGATSRSALLALARLGVTEVRLAARNLERAGQAARCAAAQGLQVHPVRLGEWAAADDQLVVSALPPEASGVAAEALEGRRRGGTLMDVVYAGWPTPLGRAADVAGMAVVSGLDMLVHQAAEQFRLFTGLEPPVQAMFAAGREAIGR